MGSVPVNDVPADLPVADGSLEDLFLGATVAQSDQVWDDELTEDAEDLKNLEDIAHQSRALISSDALRFIKDRIAEEDQADLLRSLISRGRTRFPLEDGWLILNLSRIEELYDGNMPAVASDTAEEVTVVEPTGSLAEAILSGNVTHAYALIDHRPMVALSAAASDLDSLYRLRLGEETTTAASELLKEQVAKLNTRQLEQVIRALTSALDGTYHDERSAVKMAILKAVQVLSSK